MRVICVVADAADVVAVVADVLADEVCRYCANRARFLPHVSRTAGLDYYTCDACGYFWCVVNPQQSVTLAPSGVRRFLADIFRRRRS